MTKEKLFAEIQRKCSFLCVGLDTDIRKIPQFIIEESEEPLFAFNKAIIDATQHLCVAYKLNLAFYECMGSFGVKSLETTIRYIQENYPEIFIICDGKRGDVGPVSEFYARTYFEYFKVDALTVSPYMGADSVLPMLNNPEKVAILLTMTANEGSEDFQMMQDVNGEYLYERVIRQSKTWASDEQIMYLVGSTNPKVLERIRLLVPEHFILVSGMAQQVELLDDIASGGMTKSCGLLVNASRNIIYADNTESFALRANEEADILRRKMAELLYQYELIETL